MQIVDNRPPPGIQSTGAIPNAVNIPAPMLLAEDGTTKSVDEIKEIFTSKGVDMTKPVAFSCGGGIMATLGYACAVKAGI